MDTDKPLTFGRGLKLLLDAAGMTQTSLGVALGKKDQTTVSRWVRGTQKCPPKERRRIEEILRPKIGITSGFLDRLPPTVNGLKVALAALAAGSPMPRLPTQIGRVSEAPIDADGIPKHLRNPTEALEVVAMVAERVGVALTTALQENEVGGTVQGRAWLVRQLLHLQQQFRKEEYDPGAFVDAIDFILAVDRPPTVRVEKGSKR